ncbi:MAG: TrkA family potassium uptake protein [Clostridia bacterium]|nr:TrkA family potassium uptake protein [Clostridia bacterium]
MKNFLVIGLGRFGEHLSRRLAELGNDVMVVDENEEVISRIAGAVTCAQIGDCKNEEVLRSLSVNGFDICFVCIGSDFQSSLEITSLLKEMGARRVISKASTRIQEKFLLRNGADAVIFPEKDLAYKLAVQYSGHNIFDYHQISDNIAVYEVAVVRSWIGKSIREVDVRKAHNINILAIKREGAVLLAGPEIIFAEDDHLLVLGDGENIGRLTKNT